MKPRPSLLIFPLFFALCAGAQKSSAPANKSGDFVIKDFNFHSGEALPELRLHYKTLGTPVRGEDGKVTKAVLILHGTSGSGKQYLRILGHTVTFDSSQRPRSHPFSLSVRSLDSALDARRSIS